MNTTLEIKIKQAEEAEGKGEYFYAAYLYREAMKTAKNLNDGNGIALLKKKIVETHKKMQAEMQTASAETEISGEAIIKFLASVIDNHNIEQIFEIIGRDRGYCPQYDVIAEQAKNIPLWSIIADVTMISKDGHVIKGGNDPAQMSFMQRYGLNQEIILKVYLQRLFYELMRQQNLLTEESLITHFKKSQLFPENVLKIVEVGIGRYFAEDYVSALHILVPQFETLFLSVSEKIGLDVIALEQTKEIATRTKILSAIQLDSPEFQKRWGKDFCEQLKYVLFEPLGYKLRHKVAHGEIGFEECSFATTSLMIYLFLAVTARVKKTS